MSGGTAGIAFLFLPKSQFQFCHQSYVLLYHVLYRLEILYCFINTKKDYLQNLKKKLYYLPYRQTKFNITHFKFIKKKHFMPTILWLLILNILNHPN